MQNFLLTGAAGSIETVIESPVRQEHHGSFSPRYAIVAHPHPLFGGSMDNKVVTTLSRVFVAAGYTTIRFNFRGVGASAGTHDDGIGEVRDMLQVIAELAPEGELAIAGFSFGAFVASHVIAALGDSRPLAKIILVGTAASRFAVATIPSELHPQTLVVHAFDDEVVDFDSVKHWATPQNLPITAVPEAGHFFHGRLPLLKRIATQHVAR